MGMHGFSKKASISGISFLTPRFNPRWGCMGFQSQRRAVALLPDRLFQSPMGMHGFSKFRQYLQVARRILVSIPDGDAWVFKVLIYRCYKHHRTWFQSPMGMHGFSKERTRSSIASAPRCFNPRWGCMGFQRTPVDLATPNIVMFQSPMGMHGFSKCCSYRFTRYGDRFQSPMGMHGFSKPTRPAPPAPASAQFQSPMGMHGFSKVVAEASTCPLLSSFNPRWGCMGFQRPPLWR